MRSEPLGHQLEDTLVVIENDVLLCSPFRWREIAYYFEAIFPNSMCARLPTLRKREKKHVKKM